MYYTANFIKYEWRGSGKKLSVETQDRLGHIIHVRIILFLSEHDL